MSNINATIVQQNNKTVITIDNTKNYQEDWQSKKDPSKKGVKRFVARIGSGFGGVPIGEGLNCQLLVTRPTNSSSNVREV